MNPHRLNCPLAFPDLHGDFPSAWPMIPGSTISSPQHRTGTSDLDAQRFLCCRQCVRAMRPPAGPPGVAPPGSLLGSHRRNCFRFYSALIALRSREWGRPSVVRVVAVGAGGSDRNSTHTRMPLLCHQQAPWARSRGHPAWASTISFRRFVLH